MDEEARPAGAHATGDKKCREVLGENHRLVQVCRIWAELQEHPVIDQWGHPDRCPSDEWSEAERVVHGDPDVFVEGLAWLFYSDPDSDLGIGKAAAYRKAEQVVRDEDLRGAQDLRHSILDAIAARKVLAERLVAIPDGPAATEWRDRVAATNAQQREALTRAIAEDVVGEYNDVVEYEAQLDPPRPRRPLDPDGPEAEEILTRVHGEIRERVELVERLLPDVSEVDLTSWLLEPFVELDPASWIYAAVLVRELRAYGFSWEVGEDGEMPRGPGGGESMPRKHGGQGPTLYRVVVVELAEALAPGSLDRPAEDDPTLRKLIAEALPAPFTDDPTRSDPGARGRLADALKNERRSRVRRRRR